MTTTAMYAPPIRSSRWILIVSLALNLFFVGTAGTLAFRHYVKAAQPAGTTIPARTAAARIERLAAPLPKEDGEKLRASFRQQEAAAERARAALNTALDNLQATLRKQPYDPDALRAALLQIRTTRPLYEAVMAEIYSRGVDAMSPEGRIKLADWPPPRPFVKH
jgi:uncharacterized membrane protein